MSLEKKTIFIHIPKTGGTSINCELMGTDWQTTPDFYYRHIIYETKKSNSADIFDKSNLKKYQNYNVFMFVREPIERLFSEYYFLKDRPEFFNLLSKKPANFYEYCLLVNTQNSMIKFLLGQKIYSNKKIMGKDWSDLLGVLNAIPIQIGVFEKYEESLSYLAECYDLEWSATIEKKRITIFKPSDVELTPEQFEEIKMLNKFDYELYTIAYDRLNQSEYDELDITITGSKYDYVLKYTERFILFESSFKDKRFLELNRTFFSELNSWLHEHVNDGMEYAKKWNWCVYNAFLQATKEISQTADMYNGTLFEKDPLEVSVKLSEIISDFLNSNPNIKIQMNFDQNLLFNYPN